VRSKREWEQQAAGRDLYYAALRPEEAVALRTSDCHLPTSEWGVLRLAAATPRTAAAWTSDGAPAMNSAGSSTGQTGQSG
jgi:hypothetical protein